MKLQQLQQNYLIQSSEQLIPDQATKNDAFWGKDGFSFGDVLDVFNPLHHLPVVSKYYRKHSQDDACEGSKIIGGALFGGLIGGVAGVLSSMANSAIRHETSQDVSDYLITMVGNSLSVSADSSSPDNKVNKPFNSQMIPVAKSHESNPFFAHLLASVNDEQINISTLENASSHRIREWGKV